MELLVVVILEVCLVFAGCLVVMDFLKGQISEPREWRWSCTLLGSEPPSAAVSRDCSLPLSPEDDNDIALGSGSWMACWINLSTYTTQNILEILQGRHGSLCCYKDGIFC